MKRVSLILGIVASLGLVASAQAAGDAQAGKAKAASCAGCHGPNGQGSGNNPAIAGMKEGAFVQMLKDYKSGKKPSPVMKTFAAQMSDQDMANLAAYYASLKK